MPAPVNYTTKISADKTVGEIQSILALYGAQRISTDYENGRPSGLTFSLMTEHGWAEIQLPVDVPAMKSLLVDKNNAGQLRSLSQAERTSTEHAERVAWRIMKDWIQAQMALVESRMLSLTEVMLPYIVTDTGKTYLQRFRENTLQLEARK